MKTIISIISLFILTTITFSQSECPSNNFIGRATFVDGLKTMNGHCNLQTNEYLPIVCAINVTQFDNAQYSGTCLEISGQKTLRSEFESNNKQVKIENPELSNGLYIVDVVYYNGTIKRSTVIVK